MKEQAGLKLREYCVLTAQCAHHLLWYSTTRGKANAGLKHQTVIYKTVCEGFRQIMVVN
jgi:hypothetical protein